MLLLHHSRMIYLNQSQSYNALLIDFLLNFYFFKIIFFQKNFHFQVNLKLCGCIQFKIQIQNQI